MNVAWPDAVGVDDDGLPFCAPSPVAASSSVPRRCVVERSFGWLGRWRRLSKDYEERTDAAEAMVILAAIGIMRHCLVHPNRKCLSSSDV